MDCSTPGFPVLHSPGVCSDSCPLSWWRCLVISFSAALFSSCLQSSPASGAFLKSQLSMSDGQNTGASASASVLPVNIQGWFPLGLTGLISLQSKGLSRVFSSTTIWSKTYAYAYLIKTSKLAIQSCIFYITLYYNNRFSELFIT